MLLFETVAQADRPLFHKLSRWGAEMVTVTALSAAAAERSHCKLFFDTIVLKQRPLSTKSPSPYSTAAAFVGCWLNRDEPRRTWAMPLAATCRKGLIQGLATQYEHTELAGWGVV
jgi:hypothetical protein